MMQSKEAFYQKLRLESNSGLTLIELIVSVLVSSVVVLSAVVFLSLALNRYGDTAEETDIMMESQIAISTMRDVIMEAKEAPAFGIYPDAEATEQYPYVEVTTYGEDDKTDYHLFVLDKKEKKLLYYREQGSGVVSAESKIPNLISDEGRYFLAEHVRSMAMEALSRQVYKLVMEFENNGTMYQTSETILVRNTLSVEKP